MRPRIKLIYDRDCPNVEAARKVLEKALSLAHLPAEWQEWERSHPQSPEYVRGHGSPTILINGQDVDSAPSCSGSACRIYASAGGQLQGVPPVDAIYEAVMQSLRDHESTTMDV